MVKETYKSPRIFVEDLDRADVLLASPVITPDDPKRKERENAYGTFLEFIGSGNWF